MNPVELLTKFGSSARSLIATLDECGQKDMCRQLAFNVFYMCRVRGKLIRDLEIYADYMTRPHPIDQTEVNMLWSEIGRQAHDLENLMQALGMMFGRGLKLGELKNTIDTEELMMHTWELVAFFRTPDPMHTDEEVSQLMAITGSLRGLLEELKRIAEDFDQWAAENIGPDLGSKATYKKSQHGRI